MATKVYMEALSPTMEEGRLISWLKNEGDDVSEGDVLAEVETDKATMELVARGSGKLRKVLIGEGDNADVGTVIGVIASEDEDISSLVDSGAGAEKKAEPSEPAEKAKESTKKDRPAVATVDAPGEKEDKKETPPTEPTGDGDSDGDADGDGRVRASPLARRLAAESGVEIRGLKGSGPGGRIVKRDIEAAIESGPAEAEVAAPVGAPPTDGFRDVPLSQMRKTIARRLTQSIGPVPHFFLTVEVDMGEAMALRSRINERYKDQGIKVSPNDLIIKFVGLALRKHPWVNAAWTGDAIRLHDEVHIGVAVAVEEGLITPVIRNADRKGVTEIATEVKELAGRARDKKLKPDEYTGSTFSISNLGMFGIEEFTAVINPPEAAILAVGAVSKKVVEHGGEIAVRQRMRITMSCDHRVVDGATGAQFLQTLKGFLEDPMLAVA